MGHVDRSADRLGAAVAASEEWPEQMGYTAQDALFEAALLALRAPSIANTQPWQWRLRGAVLELRADRSRQLSLDPSGRLLTVSCGAALHHARVMLAVQGHQAAVAVLPRPTDPDLLAELRIAGPHEVQPEDMSGHHGIRVRKSDRRPFRASSPPPEPALARVCEAAQAQGVAATVIEPEELRFLGFASSGAATIEARAMACQEDFADWSFRTAEHPPGSTAEHHPGRYDDRLHGHGDDQFARYLVLSTSADEEIDWLRAGEATSAALLAATTVGLASSVLSEAVEVPGARALLRSVAGKLRHPQLVLRVGINETVEPPPESRRRPASEVIEIVDGADIRA